jgi:hypothetical protein
MNFKEATDDLFDRISHEELAEALGVSVASIRQARLSPTAKAFREPPRDWQRSIMLLAEKQARHHQKLAERLRREMATKPG